jgi:CDP-glucose 4,6-dehydratase
VAAILRHWPGEWKSTGDPNAPHEAGQLHLAIDKAAALLPWRPTWDCQTTIRETVEWYRERHVAANPAMRDLSLAHIDRFMADARSQEQAWARSPIS